MEAVIISFFAVATAELGDKTQLVALCLASRFRNPNRSTPPSGYILPWQKGDGYNLLHRNDTSELPQRENGHNPGWKAPKGNISGFVSWGVWRERLRTHRNLLIWGYQERLNGRGDRI